VRLQRGLGQVLEQEADEDVVEGLVLEGQAVDVRLLEGHVGETGVRHPAARLGEGGLRDVHRDDASAGAACGEMDRLRADAAAGLEHAVPGREGDAVVEEGGKGVRLVGEPLRLPPRVAVDVIGTGLPLLRVFSGRW
jgi:hypothetical protein